jgi:hypothetical protein
MRRQDLVLIEMAWEELRFPREEMALSRLSKVFRFVSLGTAHPE